MKRIIPDTNILLRFLVGDVKEQHDRAVQLLRKGELGKVSVVIMPIIVAEACFVLNKFYKRTYAEIAEAMEAFLAPTWLEIEHREALRGMWDSYREGLHFVDSYLLALKKYEKLELLSFDQKLVKKSRL